jgi:hypothetical protein
MRPSGSVKVRFTPTVFDPAAGLNETSLAPAATLAQAIEASGADRTQPLIVLINGVHCPRFLPGTRVAAWDIRLLAANDEVTILQLPGKGGGGSNPLRILAMIAVVVAATLLGPQIALALGYTATGTAASIATSVLMMAGTAVVNALLPPPKPATGTNQGDQPSPTYALYGQGNYARLGQAIPELFGRHILFPDLLGEHIAFEGNEQILYKALCLGRGQYDVEEMRFADTAFWRSGSLTGAFPGIEVELVPPGATPTLFSDVVVTQREVSGQTLKAPNEAGGWIGWFNANAAGSQAVAFGFDIVSTRGFFKLTSSGAKQAVSVTVTAEAQPIDDAGAPSGAAVTLFTETLTASLDSLRTTILRQVSLAGRYRVRLKRTTSKANDNSVYDELAWAGLKAYFAPSGADPDVTRLYIRAIASDQLQGGAASQVNTIQTRKLPTWNGTAWTSPAATRDIAPALRAMALTYLPADRIDMEALQALDATWKARGDRFDGVFDSARGFWEALEAAAATGRARPLLPGGRLTFVRDEPRTLVNAAFGPRNIIAGSFSIERMHPDEATPDAIVGRYMDERTWTQATVSSWTGPGEPLRPKTVDLFGRVTRAHGFRDVRFMDAENRYRRNFIAFDSEMEGRMLWPAHQIAVTHDVPQWGESHAIVSIAGREVTLAGPLDWTGPGPFTLGLKQRNGKLWGPVEVTAIAGAPEKCLLPATLPPGLSDPAPLVWTVTANNDGRAEAGFGLFGTAARSVRAARVMGANPRSAERVSIRAVIDDPRVHTADQVAMPAEPAGPAPPAPEDLAIGAVTATSDGGGNLQIVTISVTGAPDARSFDIEINGQLWGNVPSLPVSLGLAAGDYTIRVRARGRYGAGDWAEWSGALGAQPNAGAVLFNGGEAATPAVYAQLSSASVSVGTAWQTLVFGSVRLDNTSSYSGTTGVFTAPSPGVYRIEAELLISAATAAGETLLGRVLKNGAALDADLHGYHEQPGSRFLQTAIGAMATLAAGDTLAIQVQRAGGTAAHIYGPGFTRLLIEKVSA